MQLIEAISGAYIVREQYKMYFAVSYPLSIDLYVKTIADVSGYKVEVCVASANSDWVSNLIRGKIHRYDAQRKANIYVARVKDSSDPSSSGITFCEQRFIVVKEACHLLIDDDKTYTKEVSSLIENLCFNVGAVNEMPEHNQSEVFAKIAALELLFPWEERAVRKAKIDSGSLTCHEVAQEYKIPERHVAWVLSDRAHPALVVAHASFDNIIANSVYSKTIPT